MGAVAAVVAGLTTAVVQADAAERQRKDLKKAQKRQEDQAARFKQEAAEEAAKVDDTNQRDTARRRQKSISGITTGHKLTLLTGQNGVLSERSNRKTLLGL
jgi:hypothetical protein